MQNNCRSRAGICWTWFIKKQEPAALSNLQTFYQSTRIWMTCVSNHRLHVNNGLLFWQTPGRDKWIKHWNSDWITNQLSVWHDSWNQHNTLWSLAMSISKSSDTMLKKNLCLQWKRIHAKNCWVGDERIWVLERHHTQLGSKEKQQTAGFIRKITNRWFPRGRDNLIAFFKVTLEICHVLHILSATNCFISPDKIKMKNVQDYLGSFWQVHWQIQVKQGSDSYRCWAW
jgi:hypothetical protein